MLNFLKTFIKLFQIFQFFFLYILQIGSVGRFIRTLVENMLQKNDKKNH